MRLAGAAKSGTPGVGMIGPVSTPTLSAHDARRLLMDAQGLLDDPDRPATPRALARLVDRLGFVQLDSINVVDRGHHLTLGARLHGYRPRHLAHLLERRRCLFEHWTHDASAIPIQLYPHWKHRFRRFLEHPRRRRWLARRMGPEPEKVLHGVRRRLRREGPLRSRDFETPAGVTRESWWGWTPHKTALEVLWHTGAAAIAGRDGFHKIYDLAERVHPDAVRLRISGPRQHVDWACSSALERLAVASAGEIADFWKAVRPADAHAWCRDAERRGRLVAVRVEDAAGGALRPAWAVADFEARIARLPDPPPGLRVLGPFDPVIRDRRRLARRFGFDYRFEAFVPARQRVWGYYVLPLLEGDRFVGRIDPKLHRDEERLEVRSLYWEPGVAPSPARRQQLEDALAPLARRLGARILDLPRSSAR